MGDDSKYFERFKVFLNSSENYSIERHSNQNTAEKYLDRCRNNIFAEVQAIKGGYGKEIYHGNDIPYLTNKEKEDLQHHLIKYKINGDVIYYLYPDELYTDDEYYQMFDLGFIGSYLRQYINTFKCNIPDYVISATRTFGKYKNYSDDFNIDDGIPCNEDQQDIVKNLEYNLEIIQGPPGTGKSTTIYHIVTKRLLNRTLVTSRNNQAIGAVCEKLSKHHTSVFEGGSLHLAVLGNMDRISEASKPFHINNMVRDQLNKTPELVDMKKKIRSNQAELSKLKAKENKLKKEHLDFINTLNLEHKHYCRLIVFLDETPSKASCMKGYDRYAARLKNKESYIRMLDKTTKNVTDLKIDRVSLLNAIDASKECKGPAFCTGDPSIHILTKELNRLQTSYDELVYEYTSKYEEQIMKESNVFLSTISSAWRASTITTVIIDEAATVEEESMPGVFTCTPTNMILIGDHKQLKPFTNINKHEPLSFFERMVNNGHHVYMLKTQYRMAPSIGNMVSEAFYGGRLKHGVRYESDTLKWIDHDSPEEKNKTSTYNEHEIDLMYKQVLAYIEANPSKSVMVITFYKAQFYKLKDVLDEICKVVTVDACQGTEADAVFLSCVRSNHYRKIGFCKNWNRLCVALSRAKESLFIIGNIQTFRKDWKRVIKNIKISQT